VKSFTRMLCLLAICLLVAFVMGEVICCAPAEVDHDCTGDRCAVCFLMMSDSSSLGTCILLLILFSAFLIPTAHHALYPCRPFVHPAESTTPVYLKVKLSN